VVTTTCLVYVHKKCIAVTHAVCGHR